MLTTAKVPFFVLVSCAAALALAELWALQQPLIAASSYFSLIVVLDLAIVAPAIGFLLVRRRRPLAWQTLTSYMALGGLVSVFVLRNTSAYGLFGLVLLELLSLAFFAPKMLALIGRVRAGLEVGEPLEQALYRSLEAVYGGSLALPVFRLALTEVLLVYYGLFGLFRRTPVATPDRFSYHRSQDLSVSLALVFITMFETVPLHLLVHQWSGVAAWFLTGLSLYTLLWLLGDLQALRLKPLELTATHLRLYTGLRRQALIPLDAVAELVPAEAATAGSYLDLSLSKTPQFHLRLKYPVSVLGLFGQRTDVTSVGVAVDDPERFRVRVQAFLGAEL